MNSCTRLDSVVGVSNIKSYSCDTLPSQVPVRKMEHESTVETSSLLLDTSNLNFRVMRTYRGYCSEVIFVSILERMLLFRLVAHYAFDSTLGFTVDSTFGTSFDQQFDSDSDAYFGITPPETPISLRSSL